MSGSGHGSASDGSRRFPSRLEAINKHLDEAIRTAAGMDRDGATIVRFIAYHSDVRGRFWNSPARMAEATHINERRVREKIADLAGIGFLFYVRPAPAPALPLPWKFRRDVVKIPTAAWGFWVPLAACTKSPAASESVCLASMREHIVAAKEVADRHGRPGLWPIVDGSPKGKEGQAFNAFEARVIAWEANHGREAGRAHEDVDAMQRAARDASAPPQNPADLDDGEAAERQAPPLRRAAAR